MLNGVLFSIPIHQQSRSRLSVFCRSFVRNLDFRRCYLDQLMIGIGRFLINPQSVKEQRELNQGWQLPTRGNGFPQRERSNELGKAKFMRATIVASVLHVTCVELKSIFEQNPVSAAVAAISQRNNHKTQLIIISQAQNPHFRSRSDGGLLLLVNELARRRLARITYWSAHTTYSVGQLRVDAPNYGRLRYDVCRCRCRCSRWRCRNCR